MKHNPNPPENHHLDKYKHVITISNLAPVYPLPSIRSRLSAPVHPFTPFTIVCVLNRTRQS